MTSRKGWVVCLRIWVGVQGWIKVSLWVAEAGVRADSVVEMLEARNQV